MALFMYFHDNCFHSFIFFLRTFRYLHSFIQFFSVIFFFAFSQSVFVFSYLFPSKFVFLFFLIFDIITKSSFVCITIWSLNSFIQSFILTISFSQIDPEAKTQCSWARPAILVVGKGRGGMFLFLLFLHFHSCSSFFPVPLFHLLYSLFCLFSPFLWEATQNDPQGLTCR